MNHDDRVTRMWDYLVAHPEGVTIDDLAADQEADLTTTRKVLQGLRDLLGGGDTINVVCEPIPGKPKGRWRYTLVGNPEGARWWSTNRITDTERRLLTIHDIAASMVAATDGRTIVGRKARVIQLWLGRCIEDLQRIGEETA
jgi:hypothetical protein